MIIYIYNKSEQTTAINESYSVNDSYKLKAEQKKHTHKNAYSMIPFVKISKIVKLGLK